MACSWARKAVLVGAGQGADVDFGLAGPGDDVHLLADVDDVGRHRVTQHGVQGAAQDRVGDTDLELIANGILVARLRRPDHGAQAQRLEESRARPE